MKLYNADCVDILKILPDKSVDAVICDPPYETLNEKRKDRYSYYDWDICLDYSKVIPEIKRIVKKNGCICIFDDMKKRHKTISKFEELGLTFMHELIWYKSSYMQPFLVNQKPIKDVEYMLMFSAKGEHINFYNCYEIVEKICEFKYAYWCTASDDTSNAVKVDFKDAMKKVLEGDDEYMQHIRFSSINKLPDNITTVSFTQHRIGPSMKYFMKLLKDGTIYIEDEVFKRKYKASVNGKKVSSIIECNVEKAKLHPTQKPLELMKKLVSLYSKEGDVVLDFCMGSGTTGLACKELNRDFIGIEKDPHFYDVAKKRLDYEEADKV